MLINHFPCYCLKKLPIIFFLKRRVMLRTQLNITVAIRLLTTFSVTFHVIVWKWLYSFIRVGERERNVLEMRMCLHTRVIGTMFCTLERWGREYGFIMKTRCVGFSGIPWRWMLLKCVTLSCFGRKCLRIIPYMEISIF